MALRNITNNTNFLLKKKLLNNKTIKQEQQQQQQNKKYSNDMASKENEQQQQQLIQIETLACSPSKKKLLQTNMNNNNYLRTSSPIQQQQSHKIKSNSAAITQLKTLKTHEPRSTKHQHQQQQHKYKTTSRSRSSKNERKLNSKCNGMLKVALYNNCGLMTVHVIQARNLRLQQQPQQPIDRLDTYARVTMLPDYEQRLKCQTTIIKDSKNPIFDEKFSFEFGDDDYNNRLLISIWSKTTSQTPCSSILQQHDLLIGCFSFKIKHLMKRDNMNVCSWYYLLPTYELGSVKHYKVKLARNYNLNIQPLQQQQQRSTVQPAAIKHEPQQQLTEVNKNIIGLNKLRFCIERNEITNDFGFTISGNFPCIVSKVDPEKDAFAKGLRPGDYIVKIHDINVSRATCESVVKLIKNCKSKLLIEIHRDKSSIKIVNKNNNNKRMNDEITAQYINQIYFNNNNSTATTDTTTSTTSLSAVNTDFSGKSIDLPQYKLKLYSLNEINASKATGTTATTTTTTDNDDESFNSNLQVEHVININNDAGDDEEDDNEFYDNLVPNQVELNEIPFVDEAADDDDNDDENDEVENDDNKMIQCGMMIAATAQYYQQNAKICKSRNIDCLLIKNEARTRTPLIATTNLDNDDNLPIIDPYSFLQTNNNGQFI